MPETKQLLTEIDTKTLTRFKIYCLEAKKPMQKVLGEMIKIVLKNQKK